MHCFELFRSRVGHLSRAVLAAHLATSTKVLRLLPVVTVIATWTINPHGLLLNSCLDPDDLIGAEPEAIAHLHDLIGRTVHFSEGAGRDLLRPQMNCPLLQTQFSQNLVDIHVPLFRSWLKFLNKNTYQLLKF